ncbi:MULTISPECIES: TRAP transporter small permease subunit [unclassified Sphingobium]|uniref:TRAP transporter small permease subunit n=1 Tax=unclassified Sphingobium TaxID=2611147 RepID=UPI002224E083|nr:MULTISPECIES: TRAP transporter small permease subunit [unclassified Sphingobium]MCW2382283.1 TRAP-type C4-dicarboxylate transport system permease small subunit [Sphingobium sp. B2D3B]MCW2397544.1 TRAP-type C4-dicarboxylate transport system permease small subunit [Sphingobium sp. B2D3C]
MNSARVAMVWIGGGALIAAALLNLLAVIGRHTGLPLKGAIELVQVAVLVAGALALVAATIARNHARVHLILDRLTGVRRDIAERTCTALSIVFYAGLLAGSCWLAFDLWNSQEVSELVGVPWRWMRAFLNASLVVVIVLLVRQLSERPRS